jgi:metallo-beta-lactamase class B
MFAKSFALIPLCTIALLSCAPIENRVADTRVQTNGRAELAKQCEGRDGWSDPAPPAQIFGNVYLVGTCGIISLLITSDKGHILIDGATQEAAPSIAQNIRKLGFDPKDIRYLLYSHEHVDHVGGLAALKQITGAKMLARLDAKASLESGVPEKSDPQFGGIPDFHGIKVDRLITDNETITLGPLAIKAIASPGHAPGGTSWTWRSCEGSVCNSFVYADSLSSVSGGGYRFSDNPQYVSTFRMTIARIASIASCDILITPHPSQSQFFERLSGAVPLIKQTACADYATAALGRLDARLAKEAAK